MKFQSKVGNTTYTIEDQPGNGVHVKLSRFNPSDDRPVDFFVPVRLLIEYVVAMIAPGVVEALTKITKVTP